MNQLFPSSTIKDTIEQINLNNTVNFDKIQSTIQGWLQELNAGKLDSLKEEECKSRFVTDFFGQILGFNPKPGHQWLLREEKKTKVDGTKSDAALGYFYKDKSKDITFAVIEIKDAKTNLDAPQNRKSRKTPVSQAFEYAAKMGDDCKWVIVSNIKETRFYFHDDNSKYQSYMLSDLPTDNTLKELLYLFSKDNFVKKQSKSKTEKLLAQIRASKSMVPSKLNTGKNLHILDQIYSVLKNFEGFRFVDPNYIASIAPFNILKATTFHYKHYSLFTLNSQIYDLLQGIAINADKTIEIADELRNELRANKVEDYDNKLKFIFEFLNDCFVNQIIAVKNHSKYKAHNSLRSIFTPKQEDMVTLSIDLRVSNPQCDCISCKYSDFKWNDFLMKLEQAEDSEAYITREYAYAFFLAGYNDFKKSYAILRKIEAHSKGCEGKEIDYFLAKYNLKLLTILVKKYYSGKDKQEIIDYLDAIDLDTVISDELETIPSYVRSYLIQLKENKYRHRAEQKLEEYKTGLENLKRLYDNGGESHGGTDYIRELYDEYLLLCAHVQFNYQFDETFKWYADLTLKALQLYITSYSTKEVGIKEIPRLIIHESLLRLSSGSLSKELSNIVTLRMNENDIENLARMFYDFLISYYKDGIFNKSYKQGIIKKFSWGDYFEYQLKDAFANFLILFNKIDLSSISLEYILDAMVKFLKVETELDHRQLQFLNAFINSKGNLFTEEQLYEILKIAINGYRIGYTKYDGLISACCYALHDYYPSFRLSSIGLVKSAIANCYCENAQSPQLSEIISLLKVTDDQCSALLVVEIDKTLDIDFNCELYSDLLRKGLYDYNKNGYFGRLAQEINQHRNGYVGIKNGKPHFNSFLMYNFSLLIYLLDIDFERAELKQFTDLGEFEQWMLNPIKYDYSKFDVRWLLAHNDRQFVFNRLKPISTIKDAIEQELKKSFDAELARILHEYF